MEELRCIGCGSIIQSENKKEVGYVPKSKLAESGEDLVCRRCFRLKNYNEVTPISITKDDYMRTISEIGNDDCLVVMLIDIFDIEGSMIPQITRLTNNNDLIVIANKYDLLPKNTKQGKVVHQLKRIMSENNLRPLGVYVMSATKKQNIDFVFDKIYDFSEGRNIYIVGATNVGKSTFINTLLRSYADSRKDIITISCLAGTTLDFIKIPFEDRYIIDTPGLVNDNQMTHYVSQKGVKALTPKKPIKPQVYTIDKGQTLFFGGVARFDYVKGWPVEFTCYVSEFLKIHRTKLENADEVYQKHYKQLLTPPFEEDEDLDLYPQTFKSNATTFKDLVIPGVGFITFKGDVTITLHVPKGILPYLREALM